MKASEFTDNLSEEEFREEIGEMAHLWEKYSGLPYIVMIDSIGIERKRKNNLPRIMISLSHDYKEIVPISIDKYNPEILIDLEDKIEFKLVSDWIKKHYSTLMRHWNQEISDFDALDLLSEE